MAQAATSREGRRLSAPTNSRRRATKARPRPGADDSIRIALDPTQINEVLRVARGSGSLHLSHLVGGDLDRLVTDDVKLSRSLVRGLLTYVTIPDDGRDIGVAEVARQLHMNTSTAHRYITTLMAVGLIERHPRTRRYRRI